MGMRNNKNLLESEEGQILVYVLIVALVASLVISPLIGLTYSGYRSASISNDKMAQFYAADTGIEDAIYQIVNRGNDTHHKVPVAGNTTTTSEYWMLDDEGNKQVINGCNVYLYLERIGNATDTYIVQSTSIDINGGAEKSIIQAQVTIGLGNTTDYKEGPGEGDTNPFQYALASLGPYPVTLQGAGGGSPLIIRGDIYSSSDMTLDTYVRLEPYEVEPGVEKPSSIWVNGSLTMKQNSFISGDAHANGYIHLYSGAGIGYNAFANGYILMDGGDASIGNSSYAIGDITLNDTSKIGGNAEAGGNISVLHGTGQADDQTKIFGNAQSSQNIVVLGQSVGPKKDGYPPSAFIGGTATTGGTITVLQLIKVGQNWYSGGAINGTQTPGVFVPPPDLPLLPVLVNPEIAYYQSFYYQEAHGMDPPLDDPNYPALLPDPHDVLGNYTLYESDPIILGPGDEVSLGPIHISDGSPEPTDPGIYGTGGSSNKVVLYLLDTIYVDGYVSLSNNCEIIGGGKLIATGDIEINNSAFNVGNSSTVPLIMSIYGDVTINNVGDISAVLYAPNGTVDIGVGDYVHGSVVGQSIINGNNVDLTYDERVTEIPGLPGGYIEGNETEEIPYPVFLPEGVYIEWYNVVK
jgi:hypothetical protein